jgi:hypothetical protein
MREEEEPRVYVHELGKKIADSKQSLSRLSRLSGVPRSTLNDNVTGKIRDGRVSAGQAAKLAEAVGGEAKWSEWRDPRPGFAEPTPNQLRLDTAEAFLAAVAGRRSRNGESARPAAEATHLAVGQHPEIKVIPPVKRDLADISHPPGNHYPQPVHQPFALTFRLCINPIQVGASGYIGILNATLYLEFIDRNRAEFRRSPSLPTLPGLVMKLRGLNDKWLALDLKSAGPASITLDGDDGALHVGDLIGARPGDSYRVRLEVDADTGFYSEWPPEPGEISVETETGEKRVARKRRKLIAQLRKWQKNIPSDAIAIDMVVQNWRVFGETVR